MIPQSAEPIRKITKPTWKRCGDPYWSPIFQLKRVTTVWARRYAVVNHEMWFAHPGPRQWGSAVATMVESSRRHEHERASTGTNQRACDLASSCRSLRPTRRSFDPNEAFGLRFRGHLRL